MCICIYIYIYRERERDIILCYIILCYGVHDRSGRQPHGPQDAEEGEESV